MEKLKSSLTNMVAVLTVIAVVAGAVLASVNAVTAPQIEKINADNLAAGIQAVLASESAPNIEGTDTIKTEKGEISAIVYKTDKGVAVQSTDFNGFGGALTILVGFDESDNIKGYQVLKTAETPGLGAKADTWFQEGSKGSIIGLNPGQGELTVSKDGGQVDAITASTITSRAFLRAVNAAYAAKSVKADAESGATEQAKSKDDCCAGENNECCQADSTECCEKEVKE